MRYLSDAVVDTDRPGGVGTVGITMVGQILRRMTLVLIAFVMSTALGSGIAAATELGDYRWDRRPLLLFAPTSTDPRLAEMLRRIESSRCDFVGRDMVTGVVVSEGISTLDGHALGAGEAQRLVTRFAIGDDAFSVVLIGKDGGEKLRVNGLADLQTIYAVIDGMPMRSREMGVAANPC